MATRIRLAVLAALAVVLVTPNPASGVSSPTPTVATRAVPKLGTILVDARGRTLYRFTPDDRTGRPTCIHDCAAAWPPLRSGGTLVLARGLTGRLGVVGRPDKTLQVTYNGLPLYRYVADTKPGQARGQGLGRQWFVVRQGDKRPTPTTTTRPTTTTTVRRSTSTTQTTAGSGGSVGGSDDYVYTY